jgi:hypothetical protein
MSGPRLNVFYERVLEETFGVSEGICLGTPFDLNLGQASSEPMRWMAPGLLVNA